MYWIHGSLLATNTNCGGEKICVGRAPAAEEKSDKTKWMRPQLIAAANADLPIRPLTRQSKPEGHNYLKISFIHHLSEILSALTKMRDKCELHSKALTTYWFRNWTPGNSLSYVDDTRLTPKNVLIGLFNDLTISELHHKVCFNKRRTQQVMNDSPVRCP